MSFISFDQTCCESHAFAIPWHGCIVSIATFARSARTFTTKVDQGKGRFQLAAVARDPRIPGAQNYFTYQLSRLPREVIARDPKGAVEAALAFLAREFDLVGSLARLDVFATEVAEVARFVGNRAQEKSTQEKSTQEKSTQEKPTQEQHPGGESLVTRALRWLRAETGDPSTNTPPPQPAIAHLNATDGTRGAPLDAETMAVIRAANEADLAFFERIESLAGSRLAGGRCRVV